MFFIECDVVLWEAIWASVTELPVMTLFFSHSIPTWSLTLSPGELAAIASFVGGHCIIMLTGQCFIICVSSTINVVAAIIRVASSFWWRSLHRHYCIITDASFASHYIIVGVIASHCGGGADYITIMMVFTASSFWWWWWPSSFWWWWWWWLHYHAGWYMPE